MLPLPVHNPPDCLAGRYPHLRSLMSDEWLDAHAIRLSWRQALVHMAGRTLLLKDPSWGGMVCPCTWAPLVGCRQGLAVKSLTETIAAWCSVCPARRQLQCALRCDCANVQNRDELA